MSRVLVALSYPEYLRLFAAAIRALQARGVDVTLAFDKRGKTDEVHARAADLAPVEWTSLASGEWRTLLEEAGGVADYLRFMAPEFSSKPYLRRRMDKFLPARFARLRAIRTVPSSVVTVAHGIARAVERLAPEDRALAALLQRVAPDAVIVSPVVIRGRGSVPQTRLVATAQRLGIPVALAVGSWDHLSSKGLLRVRPDRVLVWNNVQRDEAVRFHGVAPETVTVTGAYAWQHWFDMRPTVERESFLTSVGLQATDKYVLYAGSSRGIVEPEVEVRFVREWLDALRRSGDAARDLAVMIRPHPGNWQHWADARFDGGSRVVVWPVGARQVFMRDSDEQAYYHSIGFSEAVVGINTSAMIESAIIGRPVLSVRYPGVAQAETVHFEYLTPRAGGSTMVADSFAEHLTQLGAVLRDPGAFEEARTTFVDEFVRPTALPAPPLDCFADAVAALITLGRRPTSEPLWVRPMRPVARWIARAMADTGESADAGIEPRRSKKREITRA